MGKDLFLLVLALIVSAVFRINLLRVIAVVDIADRLILYHDFKEIVMHCALIARRAIFMRACPCYAWQRIHTYRCKEDEKENAHPALQSGMGGCGNAAKNPT